MWLRSSVWPADEPAIGYEPHQRYRDENAVRDPGAHEGEADGRGVEHERQVSLDVGPDGPGQPRLTAVRLNERSNEDRVRNTCSERYGSITRRWKRVAILVSNPLREHRNQ